MTKEKKQFIAGAVCPTCGEQDSLLLFSLSKNVTCVSCGFQQTSEQRDSKPGTTEAIKIIQID